MLFRDKISLGRGAACGGGGGGGGGGLDWCGGRVNTLVYALLRH